MLLEQINQLGLSIPELTPALASYIPAKKNGRLVYISGQLPFKDGKLLLTGKLNADANIEVAQSAMMQCFLNGLASACTVVALDQITGVLRLGAYVASTPTFTNQHLVANGASDLAAKLFGETGKHTRSAIGVSALPIDAAVELDIIFEL